MRLFDWLAPPVLTGLLLLIAPSVQASEPSLPARNPWAADGPYPMSHHNPAQTDVTIVQGPTQGKKLTRADAEWVPLVWCSAPIVKKIGEDTVVIAGNPHGLLKIVATGEDFELVSSMPYPGTEGVHTDITPEKIEASIARIDYKRRRG